MVAAIACGAADVGEVGTANAGSDATGSSGGAIGRGSTGSRWLFCAAHFAARPLSGLLVLYSW